jgi:CheY-like chemotaxis protein
MNQNPIIIIDDDDDDLQIMKEAFGELMIDNEIIVFRNGTSFLEYMKSTPRKTFFILCDINMSFINGLELKRIIYEDEELRVKCVPFVFISTSQASNAIMKAYSFGVQGYFIKPSSFEQIKAMLFAIVNYWKHSQHPNL